MASAKQIAANRRNAKLPRGPLSAESSAAIRENAVKHGLTAKHVVLQHEDGADYDELREADAIVIALPTPLSKQREPDLSIVRAATEEIATRLRQGHLVVLESTTYPGTTRDELLPLWASRRAGGTLF